MRSANLARANEPVERADDFLDRRPRVESVELEQVDVVRAEAAETTLDGAEQIVPRRADVVRPAAAAEGGLGGDEQLVATALDRLAEDFFRGAFGVDVRESNMFSPASRQTSTSRVASATSVSPHASNSSVVPPKVPLPKLRAGTIRPERPSWRYSMVFTL